MKIYDDTEQTITEWSRMLVAKHGITFRIYSDNKETLISWSKLF